MSSDDIHRRRPPAIDSLEFARAGGSTVWKQAVDELPRLAEVVVSAGGELDCRVDGRTTQDGEALLQVRIEGVLDLCCQRCLGVVPWPISIASRLLLVAPGQPWPDDELAEDGFDAIAGERPLELLPLIEEEVLLSLPISPRHDVCQRPGGRADEQESSPFAALAKLKKGV